MMTWVKASLILLLACATFGCAKRGEKRTSQSAWTADNGKIKVLSTTAMIDDLVKEIGKERVDHLTLIQGDIDPHSYELVKGDEEKISFATVVFYNGLGLEHGASLQYQLQHHPCKVALGNEIQKRSPEMILRVDEQIDPHVWMDISLWAKSIDPIIESLSKLDPERAEYYKKNGEELRHQMLKVHEELIKKFQTAPQEVRFLVTSHDAFNYFARAYLTDESERRTEEWRKRFAAPEGLAPDGQLSCRDIQKMIDHLMNYKIGVVFPESNVNRDSLKKIVSACKEKGLPVKISSAPLYGDAMGPKGSYADSYLKMIDHNSRVLLEEWKR